MADNDLSVRLAKLLDELEAPAEAADVEVVIDATSSTLWINIDGRCAFRLSRIARLTITDRRQPEPEATS